MFRLTYLQKVSGIFIIYGTFQRQIFSLLSGVEHSELVSLGDKYFGNISLTHEYEIPEFKKCRFTGSEVITYCFFEFAEYLLSVLDVANKLMLTINCILRQMIGLFTFGRLLVVISSLCCLMSNTCQSRKLMDSQLSLCR